MSEQNGPAKHTEPLGVGAPGGRRLPNLEKLYHVPVFALRELLRRRVPGRKFGDMRQAELVSEVEKQPTIAAKDVDALYENYRYGRSLTFYLYLFPDGLTEPTIEEIQAALDELAGLEGFSLEDEVDGAEDYESEAPPDKIILMDEEQLNGIREIRFRYFVVHRFLSVDEQPDHVLQTRYGFLWLDLELGYMAILSRDERANYLLTRALSDCLQAIPLPVRFSKELVDKHFSIENVRRVSHYDPGSGVRQSISGHSLWKEFEEEITAREQRYVRPSSIYDEEVADGVISGLGITSGKGKIYLTRTLPTSVVRTWGMRRLPELVRDLQDLRASQPEVFSRSIEAINRMRLPAVGKVVIIEIADGLLQSKREDLTDVQLPRTALDIYRILAGKYFSPYLRIQCGECEELAELCPHCESRELDFGEQGVTCKRCQAVLSDGELVVLRCMDGHTTAVLLEEAFSIAPNHWLQKRMVRIFTEIGQSWSEKADYFHIEGTTLHCLRKGEIQEGHLPRVIQNYINNYWEPIAGQVHTGSGDIVVSDASETIQDNGAGKTYKNFDLRLRGNFKAGYTVEAEVTDGGGVPPQPLVLPGDRVFGQILMGVLRQDTSEEDMLATGQALFGALFPPQIGKLWNRAKGSLNGDAGLRVRLRLDSPELMLLPWELVYEEEYIGLRLRFPIVRYLDLPDPPKPLVVQPPLRVLVAVSQPDDVRPLEVDIELDSIQKALAPLADKVEMDVLQAARRDQLLSRLRGGYHVLHFIGHGAFDGNRGYLILENEEKRSDYMSAALVGEMVADTSLRLAVLNACRTSVAGRKSGLGGVAHKLVMAGMPAVVAMQTAIADRAAVAFSREFYGALADGWPVDTAVQEGRRSIMMALGNHWSRRVDWAIPTLYMRAPDGMILGV
jgi:hypothetical protein